LDHAINKFFALPNNTWLLNFGRRMAAYDYENESTTTVPDNLRKLLQSHLLEGRTAE